MIFYLQSYVTCNIVILKLTKLHGKDIKKGKTKETLLLLINLIMLRSCHKLNSICFILYIPDLMMNYNQFTQFPENLFPIINLQSK